MMRASVPSDAIVVKGEGRVEAVAQCIVDTDKSTEEDGTRELSEENGGNINQVQSIDTGGVRVRQDVSGLETDQML